MPDPFDDRLRARFGAAAEPSRDSSAVLSGLTPTLHRARRAAQIKSGVTGLAVVLASSGMAAVSLMGGGGDPQETIVAVPPPDSVVSSTSVTSEVDPPTTGAPSAVASTTFGASGSTTAPTGVETTSPSQSTLSQSTLPSTTVGSSTSASPSTTGQPSTTTTQGPDMTVIDSACGSIEVATSGGDITLIDVAADPGYEIDEKDDGPESVEVSFESPGGHCEIKAEVRDGVLWSDVSSE